jgi:hypothetical protein
MSVTLLDHLPSEAARTKTLRERVEYIEDESAPTHIRKRVLQARNHNCPGPGADDFIAEVNRLHVAYLKWRARKRGKRSATLFGELVYSTQYSALLTGLERALVERKMLDLIGKKTACRLGWHHDPETGRDDLHVLFAAKTNHFPPEVTLWAEFGGGKRHIYGALDRLDAEIAAALNAGRPPDQVLKSAPEVYKEIVFGIIGKKPDLDAELAKVQFAPANLDDAIEQLGHKVTKVTATHISVLFPGRKRPNRYNIADLLQRIVAIDNSSGGKKPAQRKTQDQHPD